MANRIKFTDQKKTEIVKTLADTGNITMTARACNVSARGMYDARAADPGFSERWDEAIQQATAALELDARRRALEGVLEPVFYKGEVVGQVRKYSDTLIIFLLKGLKPRMYRENISLDVNSAVEKVVQIIGDVCPDRAGEIRRRIQADLLDESFN